MKVHVNGVEMEIATGTSLRGVIELHKLQPEKVAIEVNKRLVRGGKDGAGYDRVLVEGDAVEIVTFVGGG